MTGDDGVLEGPRVLLNKKRTHTRTSRVEDFGLGPLPVPLVSGSERESDTQGWWRRITLGRTGEERRGRGDGTGPSSYVVRVDPIRH